MEAPYQKSWFKKGQADQNQERSSRFSKHDQASKLNQLLENHSTDLDANHKGFVSIVGAGPHDPDLLTVKAVKAIMSAEILLYDRLVNKDILELLRQKPIGFTWANDADNLVLVRKKSVT